MTPLEGCVFAAGCAVVAAHTACLLRSLIAMHSSELRDLATSTLDSLRHWCRGDGVLDDLDVEVFKRMHPRRVQMIRRASSLLSCICLPSFAYALVGMVRGSRGVNLHSHPLHTLTYLCMLLPSCGPWLGSSSRLADVWYSLVMTLQCLSMLPLSSGTRLWEATNAATVFVAIVTVAFMRGRVAIPWLMVYSICRQWSGGCNGNIFADTFDNLTWATGIGLISVLMESRATAQLRAEVQSEIMQERQAGTTALLNTLYDVVIELDADLQITDQERRLAQFLLRNGLSLGSPSFLDLLLDAERELVSARLHQCLGSHRSMAEAMRLRMRAGNGHSMEVEAFCIYYWGLSGSGHFLLGLRECGEMQGAQSSDAAGSPGHSDGWLPKDVEVAVNPYEDSCPILWRSAGFNQLIGGVPTGFSLLKLVDEPDVCMRWLQETVNFELHGGAGSEVAAPGPLEVVLHPRFGMSGRQFRAFCQVTDVSSDHTSTDSPGPGFAKEVNLALRSLRCEPARAASGSYSRSLGSASSSGWPRHFRPAGRGTQQQPDQAQMGSLSATPIGRPLSL